jgi:DNA mismatch repair protein MutL
MSGRERALPISTLYSMPTVRLLDAHTANQIAAGEVVERPAAAAKELLENALDAGATRVLIEAEEGGRTLLRITDNGCGMTPEDAELALQRHATSKIATADDLTRLHTLGFRGEALPSIASVSHFELVTRPADSDSALRLFLEGGTLKDRGEAGAPPGTRITVRHLFYNTPARLKFIKSVTTEMNHIAEIAGRLAMAHPNVAVRLMHNGREVFSTPGTGDPRDALGALWGRDRAASLLPLSASNTAGSITGYVSPAEASRPNRSQQAFFVNRRPIASRLLGHALDNAFRPLIPEGRFAAGALFLEIPPEDVDVNVHPSKTEVRFRSEREVHSLVSQAVKAAIMHVPDAPRKSGLDAGTPSGLMRPLTRGRPADQSPDRFLPSTLRRDIPPPPDNEDDPFALPSERISPQGNVVSPALPVTPTPETMEPDDPFETPPPPSRDRWIPLPKNRDSGASGTGLDTSNLEGAGLVGRVSPSTNLQPPLRELLAGMKILGQVMNTFLIGEGQDGILLIDQHVAHERILYDRLLRARDGRRQLEVQRLLIPLTVTLSGREAAALEIQIPQLRELGFEIEPFGGETYIVRAVPADLSHRDPEAILRDLVDDLTEEWGPNRSVMERAVDAVLASAACHGAIKAHMPLGMAEMQRLVEDLMNTDDPYYCPHGRPVILRITGAELLKWFKRTH